MAFKVGDTVKLTSGGELMTVIRSPQKSSPRYYCEWHDKNGQLQGSEFPEEALKPAKKGRVVTTES